MHYTVIQPLCTNFKMITTNFPGVRKLRKFMLNVNVQLVEVSHIRRKVFMPYAKNKGTDQPVHPCSLISTFVRCLDSIIPILSEPKIPNTLASFCCWAARFESTSKDRYSHDVAQILSMDEWVAVLSISTIFQSYQDDGWSWKALCNEAPFRFGQNLTSNGILTWDTVIWNREC